MSRKVVAVGWRNAKGIQRLSVARPRVESEEDRPSVAARCPTCGHVAEAPVVGRWSLPNPLPQETVRPHADCDLEALYDELSRTAHDLCNHFDWG